MTDTEAFGKIIGELGSLGQDVRELGKEVRDTHVAIAAVVAEQKGLSRRVKLVEKWQDEKDDKAEATGEQDREKLITRIRVMEAARVSELANRRARWFGHIGKVAILVLGSVLATIGPAIASAFGL